MCAAARSSGASADYTAALLAGDLIMVSVEAADSDPDMRTAADAGAAAAHTVCLAFTRALHERGAPRDGPDATAAADILYALSSPHLHQLLRRHGAGAPSATATG